MQLKPLVYAGRPAWIEVNLTKLRRNFSLILQDKSKKLLVLSIVKSEAYGHGAVAVSQVALKSGVCGLGVFTIQEGIELRDAGIDAPILLLGSRHPSELPVCVERRFTCCLNDFATAQALSRWAKQSQAKEPLPVHVKIDTGMSRYGVRWTQAAALIARIHRLPHLAIEGVLSHFAMSDERDKTFALLQLARFRQVLAWMRANRIAVKRRHLCNSGGFLDLPQAHFDMVRLGILPLGVYPSKVCRRLAGIEPVLSVKALIAHLQPIQKGDSVGYGMRYIASSRRRIGVLPLGYGDGYPRVRNQGEVLIHGRRVPVVGGVSMDSMTVDVTALPEVRVWDEAVIMGRQGAEEISVHEIAALKNSVSYDVLAGWRQRLPRYYSE